MAGLTHGEWLGSHTGEKMAQQNSVPDTLLGGSNLLGGPTEPVIASHTKDILYQAQQQGYANWSDKCHAEKQNELSTTRVVGNAVSASSTIEAEMTALALSTSPPPAPDKVELMNMWHAEHHSLANPQPQPGPFVRLG